METGSPPLVLFPPAPRHLPPVRASPPPPLCEVSFFLLSFVPFSSSWFFLRVAFVVFKRAFPSATRQHLACIHARPFGAFIILSAPLRALAFFPHPRAQSRSSPERSLACPLARPLRRTALRRWTKTRFLLPLLLPFLLRTARALPAAGALFVALTLHTCPSHLPLGPRPSLPHCPTRPQRRTRMRTRAPHHPRLHP